MGGVPSLFEYAGGLDAFRRLTAIFYQKVLADPLLIPVFEKMSPDHPEKVAAFLSQTFGGGPIYSKDQTENWALREMVGRHLERHLTEQERRRWMDLMLDSADEAGLPSDPEFRSAFVAHIEWGTRIALNNSQLSVNPTGDDEHLPRWGWGEVRGPYEIVGTICAFDNEAHAPGKHA